MTHEKLLEFDMSVETVEKDQGSVVYCIFLSLNYYMYRSGLLSVHSRDS